jgi:hypothetical protein
VAKRSDAVREEHRAALELQAPRVCAMHVFCFRWVIQSPLGPATKYAPKRLDDSNAVKSYWSQFWSRLPPFSCVHERPRCHRMSANVLSNATTYAGMQSWKACWVHALAGSNPASSATPTRGNAEADPPRPPLLAAPANARANTALGIAWIAPRPRPRRWPRRPTAELENIPYRADGSGELTRVLLRSVMTRVEIAVVHQLREMGLVLHSRPRRVNSVVPAVEDDSGHIDLR